MLFMESAVPIVLQCPTLGALDATVVEKGEVGEILLAFDLAGPALDEAIKARGAMPLPPYIAAKRAPDAQDRDDYQTVFARHSGAVAAPTAPAWRAKTVW